MLLRTFDDVALKKGIYDVVKDFTHSSKPYGLSAKYKKELQNRKIGDNTTLGVHRYTIQENTVYVVATKRLYNYSSRRGGEIVFTYFISVLNPKTGKCSYVMPSFDVMGVKIEGFMMLSEHFVQRLKERTGKDMPDFLKEVGGSGISMIDKGEGKMVASWGDYRLFGYAEGKNWYIATMVTADMLFEDQIPESEEMERLNREYNDYKKRILTAA